MVPAGEQAPRMPLVLVSNFILQEVNFKSAHFIFLCHRLPVRVVILVATSRKRCFRLGILLACWSLFIEFIFGLNSQTFLASRTARPPKIDILRKEYGADVNVMSMADIVSGDYTEALQGLSNTLASDGVQLNL